MGPLRLRDPVAVVATMPSAEDSFVVDRLRHDPDVRPLILPVAEQLAGLVVAHRSRDDHVVALLPVARRRHLVVTHEL